ncbi:XdhC family protein [Vagococcus sp. WN89Y]|uniref:XdhC family protein n=1 Tax=Vagococcus sp. WN89Y TaxID=3457258 RepID=UPI003FCC7355
MLHTSLTGLTDDLLLTPEQSFLTDDRQAILRFAVEALTSGMDAALVTLVEIHGGAARALGAQMVVREDGSYCGFVSGGCVEAAAAFEALAVIASGEDRCVRYGEGSPWFDIVLPCAGGITLSIHKLRSAQPLLAVLNSLAQREAAGLRYCPRTQTLQRVTPGVKTGWQHGTFITTYSPGVRVMVYGRSIEAQTTAALAQAAGYDVVPLDDTTSQAIDADSAVLLLWHDLERELPVLQAALAARPFYIGALGSERTHARRVEKLQAQGFSQQAINRIKAPIGIFPKARDARSLALSVLADVAAARLRQGEG